MYGSVLSISRCTIILCFFAFRVFQIMQTVILWLACSGKFSLPWNIVSILLMKLLDQTKNMLIKHPRSYYGLGNPCWLLAMAPVTPKAHSKSLSSIKSKLFKILWIRWMVKPIHLLLSSLWREGRAYPYDITTERGQALLIWLYYIGS